jgi:hypothetical protein
MPQALRRATGRGAAPVSTGILVLIVAARVTWRKRNSKKSA